jgi:predicted 3-demethylubiquinone-9 3-methyltransferase (glyoxalase superfamily)
MSPRLQRITPFLWFDDQAEPAAQFYVSIFPDSRIVGSTQYSPESAQASSRPAGSLMTVAFQLDGQDFTALNGGPIFRFNESISLVVRCHDQEEIDYYWSRLGQGGDKRAQRCGWLKDRYGLSWQVVPQELPALLDPADPSKAAKVTRAIMGMEKIDLVTLRQAAAA